MTPKLWQTSYINLQKLERTGSWGNQAHRKPYDIIQSLSPEVQESWEGRSLYYYFFLGSSLH